MTKHHSYHDRLPKLRSRFVKLRKDQLRPGAKKHENGVLNLEKKPDTLIGKSTFLSKYKGYEYETNWV